MNYRPTQIRLKHTCCLRFHSVFRFRSKASFDSSDEPCLSRTRRAEFGLADEENVEYRRRRELVTQKFGTSVNGCMCACKERIPSRLIGSVRGHVATPHGQPFCFSSTSIINCEMACEYTLRTSMMDSVWYTNVTGHSCQTNYKNMRTTVQLA